MSTGGNGSRGQPKPPHQTSRVLHVPVLGYRQLELVKHAQDRMRQRGISVQDVLQTLRHPDVTGLPTEAGRKRVRKNRSRHHAVDVVYDELADRVRVITVIRITRRPRRGR